MESTVNVTELDLSEEDGYVIINSPISIICSKIIEAVHFEDAIFKNRINFEQTIFDGAPWFDRSLFYGDAEFIGAEFYDDAFFIGTEFKEGGNFSGTKFSECAAVFSDAWFDEFASFINAKFDGAAYFEGVKFSKDTDFGGAIFCSEAFFDKSEFSRLANFSAFVGIRETQFKGDTSFRDVKFKDSRSQENACRRTKNVLEKNGDREEAGYHFYREMEAKRLQKPWYIRYPEFIFIQMIFGYGIHPFRLWASWFGFVGIFAIIYWLGHGIDADASQLKGNATMIDYIWFSIATAVTPGYAGYKPFAEFKLVAGLEAILGTFMWAAFIATFARKYMR